MGVQLESALPEGWVPDGASVHLVAHRCDSDDWEAVIPEFTIAGRGASVEDAIRNAIELLDDYLLVCAKDGLTFQQSFRPFGRELRKAMFADFVESVWATWRSKQRPRPPRSRERYKLPLRMVGVC